MKKTWKAFCAWFTPSAVRARARERERRNFIGELESFDAERRYMDAREPIIRARLAQLQQDDADALLEGLRTAPARWESAAAPAPGSVIYAADGTPLARYVESAHGETVFAPLRGPQ